MSKVVVETFGVNARSFHHSFPTQIYSLFFASNLSFTCQLRIHISHFLSLSLSLSLSHTHTHTHTHMHIPELMKKKNYLLVVPEQAQLLISNLDRGSAILRNQNLVAGLHAGRNALSILVNGAGADGDHFCFVELLDGCLGKEDAGCGFGFGLDALDEDAVEKRGDAADRLDCGLEERGKLAGEFGGLMVGVGRGVGSWWVMGSGLINVV